jgi:hypothetical protein
LPIVPHRLCRTEAEARTAFRTLGGPVAVKACSADCPHKSDLGLVALNVQNEADAAVAFTRLWNRLKELDLNRDGVIVAPMVNGRREFAVGARVDATFGPVVMIGDGGRYVEVLGDFVLLLPPFEVDDVREALFGLRIAPILRGVRGEPPLDIEPLCQSVVRLGQIMVAAGGQITSIDLNPVMVGATGEPMAIVDALVERAIVVPSPPDRARI